MYTLYKYSTLACIKTQLLSKSSTVTVASVFVLFFHVAMSSKVPRLIKKKKKKKSRGTGGDLGVWEDQEKKIYFWMA